MAELAAAGAVAFTDDGRPVASAGLMRRALAYSAVADRPLALHCEEPTLSRDGQMHEGAVSAELGLAGWPSVAESLMVERDLCAGRYEQPPHPPAAPLRPRVGRRRPARTRALGVRVSAEATPHHLCATDELVRTLDANAKMNPPLGARGRPPRARRGPPRRHDRLHRHRPRTARATREGRAVRAGAVRRDRARDGVRRPQHVPRPRGRGSARDGARAAVGRAGARARAPRAADRGRRARQPRPARPRGGVDGAARTAFRSRSANSWLLGQTLVGAVVKTVAAGRVVFAA